MKIIEAIVLHDRIEFYEKDTKDLRHFEHLDTKHFDKLKIDISINDFLKSQFGKGKKSK